MTVKRFKFDYKVKRDIKKIVVHCTATDNKKLNNFKMVKLLHTLPPEFLIDWNGDDLITCRGWSDIGYHFFINKNGTVKKGRPLERPGAHTFRENHDSIGICVAGLYQFKSDQMTALYYLVQDLCLRFNIHPKENVFPHNHFAKYKSCPNFKLPDFYVDSEYQKRETSNIGGMEAL